MGHSARKARRFSPLLATFFFRAPLFLFVLPRSSPQTRSTPSFEADLPTIDLVECITALKCPLRDRQTTSERQEQDPSFFGSVLSAQSLKMRIFGCSGLGNS